MRGIALGSLDVARSGWFKVTLGSAVEQVGYLEGDTPPGDIQPPNFRGIDFRNMLVQNVSALNEDQITVSLENGALAVNFFSKLLMRGPNQELIVLPTSAVFQFDNFPGGSPPFSVWLWKRSYRTTWPESIRGQIREVQLV